MVYCSFLIGDNDIYEGTGWHIRGSHTANYNSNSTGIGFIGNFNGKTWFSFRDFKSRCTLTYS